ncbi:PREDICTED: mucin-5AC [Elephantulus edwardii]|uniref:mucin-5AC n=1 Tax=Elephantulus edwardii TaxID=28737 RepID=UPI0003F09DBA|nr:PREDICTED: mucin-5AC [Elephantulus edwardii]
MAVGRRRLNALWALALALACAQHTGHAQHSPSESSYKYHPDLPPIHPGPSFFPLGGVTILPPMKTIPVVRALNPAHNGRVCSTWGDFHYKTFDGDIFQFPGLCNYVFSSNCHASYEDFNIQVRRGQGGNATVPSKVVMKLDGMVLQLTKSSVLVNGHPVQLPFSQSGVLIEQNSLYLKVAARMGLVFMWNLDNSLLLELDDKYANQTCGLCGDFNGIPVFNEFFSNNVKLTPVEYGNLQKLDGPMEQCQDPTPTPLGNCTFGLEFCQKILLSQPFSDCHTLVDVSSYIAACQQDACLCLDASPTSCTCPTLAEYSRQCVHAGGVPREWRTPDLCPAQGCPFNMEHRECGLPCADTCSNLEHAQLCEDHCVSGCFCPQGMVFDDINQSGCVPAAQCSCMYNGLSYPPGAVYSTGCTNCTCSGGRWSCQETPCPGTCSVLGGAHFSTFDEKQYTAHGDCSYVLAKPCDGGAFTVLAELRKCGLTDSETCLKSVTLSLGGGQTVIVVKASGEVFVNQIYTQLPVSAANVTLFRPSTFFIIAQTTFGLQLDIQLVPTMQVFLRLTPTLQGLTCGLCGNFNSIQADDFRTISGVVEGTAAAFFNTWKTQASCPNVKNSFEDPCSLSVENEKYAQHWCSLLTDTEGPFAHCHATVNPATYYSNCMFDTCNCEKTEDCLCAALSAYVHTCAAKGVLLRGWRDRVCAKPMTTCPKSLTYIDYVSTCQPTCRSLSEEDVTCQISFVPVDGCVCANGTFLDDSGKCVPAAYCPCYYRGSVVPNGESVHDGGTVCTCTKGTLTCVGGHAPTSVCRAPMVYFDCRNATSGAAGAGCQKSCHTLDMACYSPQCISGCVCPDGLVSDGEGGCIVAADCPCVHNEASYKAGQTIRVGCNACTCKNRMWQCTQEPCLATCAVYGDGHYLTFDGQRFTFEGDCEYTLVQDHCGGNSSTQGSFRVVTENIPCGTTGTTCSKAIKVFVGSYELKLSSGKVEVIEKGTGQVVPYSIRQMGIYLVVDTDVGLVLQWDKKTSLFLRLSPEFKGKVCGLCGNFDGNAINDFTTRSLSVVGDVLEFGNSWKFSPSCPDALAPRDPCTANPYRKSWAQKQCSILHSATFTTCHAHVEPTKYYEACVSDACACDSGGDCECFCTAVAAYAQACQDAGVCVSWRSPDVCPLFCDYYNPNGECEWHYQPCGAPCMRTCRNPSGRCLHDVHGLEGCYPKCPPEAPIFDEDEMQCVAQCSTPPPPPPCRVRGKDYRPGASVPSSENCKTCICTENGVECVYDAEACICTYGGQQFHPGDVIYHTADGTGSCITARCVANGTIEREVSFCDTSTAPTTTFSFSTTPNGKTACGSSGSSPQSTVSTFTSKILSTAPGTSPKSASVPGCGELCQWTPWLDVSHPGQGVDSGDFDTLQNLRDHGFRICQEPKEVKCRAENMPDVPLEALGQHVECSRTGGLICYNKDQASGLCDNYQIQILCCSPLPCPTLSSSSTASTSTPGTHRTLHTSLSTAATAPPQGSSTPAPGTHTPVPGTYMPSPGTHTSAPGSSTPAPGTHTPVPGTYMPSPGTHTSAPGSSTPAPGTHSPVPGSPTPAPGFSTLPSTISCLQERCEWTKWLDGSYPKPDRNSGDFDTFHDLRAKGYDICKHPKAVECRAEWFPHIPLNELGQNVTCSKTEGLLCLNKDQQPPICYNYEIRILCCSIVDVSSSTSNTTPANRTTTTPPETRHLNTVTTCMNQCSWSKWFDVDFPSSGPHGGDVETYDNILRLECRAENHPEVSIKQLGQVVECNPDVGLVCRNQDQLGKMCFNYEIRVLCCDFHVGCSSSSPPSVTHAPLHTSSPEPTSVTLPQSPHSSTAACYCVVADKLYPAGSIIYQETDLDGHCYSAQCTLDCRVVRHDGRDCSSTPQTPTTPSSPSPSPDHGCSDVVPSREKGETWNMPNCTQATCEGHNVITLHPRKCPPAKALTCANGYPAVKVVDKDGCCPHDECQCICSGWGDPHYITFDGTYYTFLDNCTYVLVQQIVPKYGHFRVLIDNYFCNAEDGLSCPRSIIVEYKQDRVVMTRKPGGVGLAANQVFFNNRTVQPGFRSNGIVISQLGIKMYVSIPALGVQVMFTGLIFSVEVPFSKFANNTEGQCGTCTNDQKDDCRLPDGAVVASCSEMSDHWKVTSPDQPSCHKPPPTPLPTTPTKGRIRPTPCPEAPICHLILSDVFELCHEVIPPIPYYEGCVFDQCHVTDSDVVCSSLELYALLCASQGRCIDWRPYTNHTCPLTCPANKVYQPCGPVSQTYCYGNNSASVLAVQDTGSSMEGCFCPPGMILFSENSDVCVPSDNCSWCLGPNGEPVEPGQTIVTNCEECTCDGSTQSLSCQAQTCPPLPSCSAPGHVLVPEPLQAAQCCAEYHCVCNTSLCPQPGLCHNNSHPVTSHKDGDCCPSQECVLDVCVVNGTVFQLGAVVSSSLCEKCTCQATGGPSMDPFVICETQICERSCPVGFEYRVQPGQCCGSCVQVACVMNTSDSSAHLFYPGETWSDPRNRCETHECERHKDGIVVVTTRKACPPLTCSQDKAQLSEDGCCRFCPPEPAANRSTCAVYYKEEVIRERGCSSSQPILLSYCKGNCGDTSSMYSFKTHMVEHRCLCCQELRTSLRNVTLSCQGGSPRTISYRHIEECGCEGPSCTTQSNPGHSEESQESAEGDSQEPKASWAH